MTKYALPHLRTSKGNVICAGSEAGFNGIVQNTPYGGTKAFLHSFMMGVAVEQAKYGVPTASARARSTRRGRTRPPAPWTQPQGELRDLEHGMDGMKGKGAVAVK